MNDIYSFYQLISKYKIEIPIIQRDYAQGRKDSKAEDVRKSMVADMIAAVKEDKKLSFDFVYGRIDQHKFIPFDGQQRLTTLFLFHKYVFEKCISCSACEYKSNSICKDVLLQFSYATRQSSREFCEMLVKKNVIPDHDNTKLLSENVRNMQWFYSDWEKDPTIMGMLTMLDEIHNQFTQKKIDDYKPLAEKLTSGCNCPITFHFVDMGEHKLSDETYIKMNARGKTLTPFENFKASLEQYLETKKNEGLLSRLKENADRKWLDLFWSVVNKEKELPDSLMMSFFNRHFMNVWRHWYANNPKTRTEDEFNNRIQKEMPLCPTKDDFVSWDIYQNVLDKCSVDECLTPIFNIWEKLCNKQEQEHIIENSQSVWNRGVGKAKWNLYEGSKNNDNRETYPSRVAFYALLRYFGVESNEDKTTLAQWMRIVWNIIENSIIDSSDTYQAALRLINKLSNKCNNIYDALANHFEEFELGNQYHAQDQVQEEIAKAKQILEPRQDGKSWEEIIIEAEKYAFFKGAIRFLFTDGEGNIDWKKFDIKWGNAQIYFDGDGVKEEYKVELTKKLVFQCCDWEKQLYNRQIFNPNASTWKWILCSSIWRKPINSILILATEHLSQIKPAENNNQNVQKYFTQLLEVLPFDWMVNKNPEGRFRWRHSSRLAYYKPHERDGGQFLLFDWVDFKRRDILSKIKENSEYTIKNNLIEPSFFLGEDIQFTYKYEKQDYHFQWQGNNYVRLIEDLEKCEPLIKVESSDKPEEKWYCFEASTLNKEEFIEKLKKLIGDYNAHLHI